MRFRKQMIIAASIVALGAVAGIGGYAYYVNHSTGALELKAEEAAAPAANTEEKTAEKSRTSKEPKKEETVYVKAAPDGTVKDIVVSDILRNAASADTITDQSDLKKIKNIKGKESFKKSDNGELIWNAGGNDIYYQGESTSRLPVEVKISYYLDGQKMEPKKMAGKSGQVKIRFDYVNHETQTITVSGEERTISTPFIVVTGMFLDEEKFTDVEMENGRVISDGSRVMAGGLVIPGLSESIALSEVEDMEDLDLPEYLEVSAYTTDFELPLTMTAVTADFSEEFDLDDLDKYDELKDDMQELKDASTELVDGTHELVDGVVELKDGSIELYDGAVELDDGAKELKDGAEKLDDGADELKDGLEDLKEALKTYNAGLDTLLSSMSNADGNGNDISVVAGQLAAGVDQVVDQVLKTTLDSVNQQVEPLRTVLGPLGISIPEFESVNQFTEYDFSKILQAVQQAVSQLPPEQAAALGAQAGELAGAIEKLKEAQGTLAATQTQLLTLQEGMHQLSAGLGQVYGGVKNKLKPGAQEILDGSRKLCNGSEELKEGTYELLEGTGELKDGTVELLDGTVELKDGVQELYDGSIELRDGAEEFDRDGIQKLYDLVCTDFQKVIDRARAVADAGEAYQTFTKLAPNMKGSVKFLIETEEIK
ncbi:MAG TPA: hypothetical protein DD414_00065 [Lachnospiraceae bacterium]|nr:hypothetical protein [Lachnospiraceae bacterium]